MSLWSQWEWWESVESNLMMMAALIRARTEMRAANERAQLPLLPASLPSAPSPRSQHPSTSST